MVNTPRRAWTVGATLSLFLMALTWLALWRQPLSAADARQGSQRALPVEDDTHEFMEYVFEQPYKRLKERLAEEPASRRHWSSVKSDALILAEAGNLLLLRSPAENAANWRANALRVREAGGQLYQAAKEKDSAAARERFAALLTRCNACHDQFADGEHQLSP